MLRKLSAILMTLCLTVGAMTPLAHAAGGLRAGDLLPGGRQPGGGLLRRVLQLPEFPGHL